MRRVSIELVQRICGFREAGRHSPCLLASLPSQKNNHGNEANLLVGNHDQAAREAVAVLQSRLNRDPRKQSGVGALLRLGHKCKAERGESAGSVRDRRFDAALGAGQTRERP